jgi:hypothetical protein
MIYAGKKPTQDNLQTDRAVVVPRRFFVQSSLGLACCYHRHIAYLQCVMRRELFQSDNDGKEIILAQLLRTASLGQPREKQSQMEGHPTKRSG